MTWDEDGLLSLDGIDAETWVSEGIIRELQSQLIELESYRLRASSLSSESCERCLLLQQEIEQLARDITLMVDSESWRLTRPLRWLGRVVRWSR